MLIEGRGAGEHEVGSASGAAQRNTCMLKREHLLLYLVYQECAALSRKS